MVERGMRLEGEGSAAKPVDDAAADQKRVAHDKGLPAGREVDRVVAERFLEEVAGMPADTLPASVLS